MQRILTEKVNSDWNTLVSPEQADNLRIIRDIIEQQGAVLADHFYREMMNDSASREFLTHDEVRNRLHASLQMWLLQLFDNDPQQDARTRVVQQLKVGEVHARVDVPVHLVLRGARSLKDRFHELLFSRPLPEAVHFHCGRLFSDLIDIAMEMMAHAYALSHDRSARTDEAYRLFSVTQNLTAERDRQRAAMLDWENHLIFDCTAGVKGSRLQPVSQSEFGLWFRHKGSHAFAGASEVQMIEETMQRIDERILPLLDAEEGFGASQIERLREVREATKSIRYHLELLFDKNSELESGRDVLTRLYNRKFVSTVLTHEIQYARANNIDFAVLAIDIDHFKTVNDQWGHEAGDMTLQQLAIMLSNNCRSGDFLFRMGGEEFLAVLVDNDISAAVRTAEKIRKQVAAEPFLLPGGQHLNLTLSIGVAGYNGHPDYSQLLRNADRALYEAKHSGRNKVVTAN